VELGADFSAGPGDGQWQSIAPRASLNVSTRTALEFIYAGQAERDGFSTLDYTVARVKRTLVQTDRSGVFGTFGAALARRSYSPVQAGFSPLVFPVEYSINPAVGVGAEIELGAHVALRTEAEYLIGPETRLRFSGGVSVPLGRYPNRSRADDSLALAASPAGLVRPGQTVWISSKDGREWKGEIAHRSLQGLTIRHAGGGTSIALEDIQTIDATDRLTNGMINGALAGGVSGGVFGAIAARVWCEGDAGCIPLGAMVFGGIGAGIGTLTGAVIDSFHERRRPLYDARVSARRPSVLVAPVVGRQSAGVVGTVTW
jgi:hypothetical protein